MAKKTIVEKIWVVMEVEMYKTPRLVRDVFYTNFEDASAAKDALEEKNDNRVKDYPYSGVYYEVKELLCHVREY
jgi:hypothetical protein